MPKKPEPKLSKAEKERIAKLKMKAKPVSMPASRPSKAVVDKAARTSTFTGKVDEIMNPGGRANQKKNFGSARNIPALSEVAQAAYQQGKEKYKDSTAKMSKGGSVKASSYYAKGGKVFTGR